MAEERDRVWGREIRVLRMEITAVEERETAAKSCAGEEASRGGDRAEQHRSLHCYPEMVIRKGVAP